MKSKTDYDLSLNFKVPKSRFIEPVIGKPLSPKRYAELVELGIKLLPDPGKERAARLRNAPTVRFKL